MGKYKKQATVSKDILMTAVEKVVKAGCSYNAVSQVYKIPRTSLKNYCKKYRESNGTINVDEMIQLEDINISKKKINYIFTSEEEDKLEEYIKQASDTYFVLPAKDIRRLAYQYGLAIKAKMPENWMKNMVAGDKWLEKFMGRHNTISIKEMNSVPIAYFNSINVELFFSKLTNAMKLFTPLLPCDIWNMTEIGVFISAKKNKVMTRRSIKKNRWIHVADKKQFITFTCTISAQGNFVPPFFVFPTDNFKDDFLHDGPVGCAGGANPSGWMNENIFLSYLTHFVRNVRSNQQNRILLLLDNDMSYLSISILDFAKKNGIVMLSFPPHCHNMQPLDIGMLNSLNENTNVLIDSWISNHPNQRMSIHDIPSIVKNSLLYAQVPLNILRGFRVSLKNLSHCFGNIVIVLNVCACVAKFVLTYEGSPRSTRPDV